MLDWETLPTIDAGRVKLRWITEEDLEPLFNIFSNAEVVRYWSSPALADRQEALELISNIHQNFKKRAFFNWGVARQSDNHLIGTSTLFSLNLTHRRAELGYALGREHWGQGYINEALKALLHFAFEELNLHRIEADVDPRNNGSIKTLERLGFQREGYLRERWQVSGEIQDALIYGLLKPEFIG